MSQATQTAEEVFDSLNGFDEMAITQHFGRTISDLANDLTMFARALAFVLARRAGANDDDARNAVYGMTLAQVNEQFAEESAESGKDVPPEEQQPETSPPSAS